MYAVDAGYGQLLGSLRQDPRVVNLEGTNLGELSIDLIPDQVEFVTLDLSYLALAAAVPQLVAVRLAEDADAVALVKPQFELGLASPPQGWLQLGAAVNKATCGFRAAGWEVIGAIESPVLGARGSLEYLVHARRRRG